MKKRITFKGDAFLIGGFVAKILLPGTGIGTAMHMLALTSTAMDCYYNPELYASAVTGDGTLSEEELARRGWIHSRNGEFHHIK